MPPDKIKELAELAKPLQEWMQTNLHPHTEVTLTQTRWELKEASAAGNCKLISD